MTNNTLPTGNSIEHDIWQQLLRASVDKHHEWRCPILATKEDGYGLDARVIILRAVDVDEKKLTFYTDSRSPKVSQLLGNPDVVLVFWSKRLNWQLRVKATMEVTTEGSLVDKIWAIVKQSPTAKDYCSALIPGQMQQHLPLEVDKQSLEKPNFALLTARVISIDWLALNRSGHQRATINSHGIVHTAP